MEMTMDKFVAYLKQLGFVYQGSEIYGGLANTWDYGPLGVELKNNLKKLWWKAFVQSSVNNVGIDSAILMNPQTWVATGHVGGFSDPLIDCKCCNTRYRADKLIEDFTHGSETGDGWDNDKLYNYVMDNKIPCPNCGKTNFTEIRKFNLMFQTHQGVVEDAKTVVYLRPETAQGIFLNFKNVQRTTRKKVPFGICQIGKSFRNEITPGNFIFRTREFEQMELEFFCKPDTDLDWFHYWKDGCMQFLKDLGLTSENLRFRDHEQEELSFYSKATSDIEYLYPAPLGWGELWGVADRTDYDLSRHQEFSKKNLEYLDPETNQKYIPYVIEPSVGADRLFLSVFADAYDEEQLENDTRIVMHLHPAVAPIKAAILPLTKKQSDKAMEVYSMLAQDFNVEFDVAGQIGKRYRRQDAIGTPFCITIDFDSETDQTVTLRDRDSMEQIRLPIDELKSYIAEKIKF